MCPGKKDSISVKIPDGTKEKVQKRLLLANTAERYSLFQSENPDVHVNFSTVTLSRAKWCIPVGSKVAITCV